MQNLNENAMTNVSPKPNSDKSYHGTTLLEYAIPDALYEELEQLIDKKVAEFEKECPCDYCVEDRKEKSP